MRLVNADEAEKFFYEHLDDNGMIGAMNAIKEMPTIEVEPVQYGCWKWVDGSLDNYDLKCTVCGGVQDLGFWKRCPYCGAKMKNGE